jgi:transposase InsO family protein
MNLKITAEHGIRHEKTFPGTPHHNGVAERISPTLFWKRSEYVKDG